MDSATAAGRRYLEHLTDTDLVLLGGRTGPSSLRADPGRLEASLSAPAAFEVVFATTDVTEIFSRVSPFLAFSLAVHRAAVELRGAVAVDEWVGLHRRLPVLGAGQLAEFLADRWRRLFLAELLASYTHVASGTRWERSARGWRRRGFSELDPVQLASLVEAVPVAERPGVYRRLGDLALFLAGVFPDASARQFPALAEERLLRSIGAAGDRPEPEGLFGSEGVGLLEFLGQRWYRLACTTASAPPTANLRVVADVADRFGQARRTLNLLADRYLAPWRNDWPAA